MALPKTGWLASPLNAAPVQVNLPTPYVMGFSGAGGQATPTLDQLYGVTATEAYSTLGTFTVYLTKAVLRGVGLIDSLVLQGIASAQSVITGISPRATFQGLQPTVNSGGTTNNRQWIGFYPPSGRFVLSTDGSGQWMLSTKSATGAGYSLVGQVGDPSAYLDIDSTKPGAYLVEFMEAPGRYIVVQIPDAWTQG